MREKKWYKIVSVITFIFLFICLFFGVQNVLRFKPRLEDPIKSFFDEPEDSIDVLALGSSHMYYGLYPMELWKEQGITSYVLGTPEQSLGCSYHLLKEGIRTQHPKVVLLETYMAASEKKYTTIARAHQALDVIPLNENKIEMGKDLLGDLSFEEKLPFYINLIQYHGRWANLEEKDFKRDRTFNKGGNVTFVSTEQTEPKTVKSTREIPEISKYYLDKIIALCKENGVELILCQMPYAGMKEEKVYIKQQEILNQTAQYAEEQGISYINFEALKNEIQLDYKTDFKERAHVNINGATKTSRYLAKYLRENCDLPDHREEEEFLNWNLLSQEYDEFIQKGREAKAGTMEDKAEQNGN